MTAYPNDQGNPAGAIPVYITSGGGGNQPATPRAATNSAIAVGGTAVILVTGPTNGCYITNPPNAAAQGVTAENAYIDPVAAPGSTDSTANGTTTIIVPGQSFTFGALALGAVIMGNAATSGHKLTVVVW